MIILFKTGRNPMLLPVSNTEWRYLCLNSFML